MRFPRPLLAVVASIWTVAGLALLLTACPTPTVNYATPTAQACVFGDAGLPTTEDICEDMVAADGRACSRCGNVSGCLDTVDLVWCVKSCDECRLDYVGEKKMVWR